MKKKYIIGVFAVASLGFFAMQKSDNGIVSEYSVSNLHIKHSAGALPGKTGAPGEPNCTQCHSGAVQSGVGQNSLVILDGAVPVTSYVPGTTYTVSVSMTSGNVKEGFEATVLDVATNSMAGSFPTTGAVGTQIVSGGGRDFATHTASSNNEGNIAWVWNWTAPATNVGDVKFYLATNVADGSASTSGDVIYLTEQIIGSTVGLAEDSKDEITFKAGYSAESNQVVVNFNSLFVGNMFVNLVDLTGKSVFTYDLGESTLGENHETITLPFDIENGMYVVNFFVGNKASTAKIIIQK